MSRPIRDLGDAVTNAPSVDVQATKTGGNQIALRGLDYTYTLILIDGKRQNVNGSFDRNGFGGAHSGLIPPVEMIERIEVLRGPASVIWGSDAIGGVINIITKKNPTKPTQNFMAETRLQEESNWGNLYGFNAYIAEPIINDKLSVSLRGKYNQSSANKFYIPSGYSNGSNSNPYTTHSPTGYNDLTAGGRINYTINSQNNLYVDMEYFRQVAGSLNTSSNHISSFNTFDKINAVLNHDGDYSFGRTTTYFQYSQVHRIPHTSSPSIGVDSGTLDWTKLIENRTYIFDSKINKGFDLRKWGFLDTNGGIYYMYESFFARQDKRGELGQHQLAAYAEGNYIINEYFSTSLGLRLNYSNLYAARPNPRFYINYNPTTWLTLKAGIASGMKIPGINQIGNGFLYSSNTTYYYANNLQAEKSWNYELSVIFDTSIDYIDITGFYNDFVDKILTLSVKGNGSSTIPVIGGTCNNGNTCTTYTNTDRAYAAGLETSFKMKPILGIGFEANYTFTKTEQLTGTYRGDPITYIPEHSANAKLSYRYKAFDMYIRYQGKFKNPISLTSTSGQAPAAREIFGRYYQDYSLVDLGLNYRRIKNGAIKLYD